MSGFGLHALVYVHHWGHDDRASMPCCSTIDTARTDTTQDIGNIRYIIFLRKLIKLIKVNLKLLYKLIYLKVFEELIYLKVNLKLL